MLDEQAPEIAVADADWSTDLAAALSAVGTARLWARTDDVGVLREALVRSLTVPVEVGYLRFFPMIERVERDGRRILATLGVRECI
jgi:hypothetical protein